MDYPPYVSYYVFASAFFALQHGFDYICVGAWPTGWVGWWAPGVGGCRRGHYTWEKYRTGFVSSSWEGVRGTLRRDCRLDTDNVRAESTIYSLTRK